MEYGVSFCICIDEVCYMFVEGALIKLTHDQVEILKKQGVKFSEIPF